MIVQVATILITQWCQFDSVAFTNESKAECAVKLTNCAIVREGVLETNKNSLQKCIKDAKVKLEFINQIGGNKNEENNNENVLPTR